MLDNLKIRIDDALLQAYQDDATGLSKVIELLPLALHKVILALGSTD